MDDEARVNELLDKLLAEHDPKTESAEEFLGAQFDYGLAFVHYPEGHGGLEVAPRLQAVVNQRLAAGGAPVGVARNAIGFGMGAPTIVTHGTEEQKSKYLRPLFTGEEMWCQLFSEPGAGSDVAGLSTRADRDGDEWIVNGQKVWTSLRALREVGPPRRPHQSRRREAQGAHLLRHRHGPARRRGPAAAADDRWRGVQRGLLHATARVPDENRLGEIGAGWSTVVTTLMNERVFIGGGIARRRRGHDPDRGEALERTPTARARRCAIASCVSTSGPRPCASPTRGAQQKRAIGNPGPEGSIGKLANAELNQAIGELCVDLMGAEGMLYDTYEVSRDRAPTARSVDPRASFLRSRANTIEGGTSEVMRNILGERVLGLPGDVRIDRGVAWKDVPRN